MKPWNKRSEAPDGSGKPFSEYKHKGSTVSPLEYIINIPESQKIITSEEAGKICDRIFGNNPIQLRKKAFHALWDKPMCDGAREFCKVIQSEEAITK